MNATTKSLSRWALIAAAAATLSACASAPKPQGPVATTQPPEAPYTPRPSQGQQLPPASPEQSGPVAGSSQDFVINIGELVYFDFNSFTLRGDATPILDSQAAWLRRYPGVRVRIEGNCDERGTREYNFALGARRANSVREYLVSRGIAAGRIDTISYGKERPLDPGSDEQAWARNRNARTAITEGAR